MKKFEANKTYEMSYIGDSELRPKWLCVKRTAKTATFQRPDDESEKMTRRIKIDSEGNEYVLQGSYSMAPCINAKRIVEPLISLNEALERIDMNVELKPEERLDTGGDNVVLEGLKKLNEIHPKIKEQFFDTRKYTPGQWGVEEFDSIPTNELMIYADGTQVVATMDTSFRKFEEAVANANLIAAAPLMLEQLRLTLETLKNSAKMQNKGLIMARIQSIESTIEKATK